MPYPVTAAAIQWVPNRRFMGPIRRAVDIVMNRQVDNQVEAKRISRLGESKPYESAAGADSRESTVGRVR